MGLLDNILAKKATEVIELRKQPRPVRPPHWGARSVVDALSRPAAAPLRLIAEVKFRSPSAGPLSRALGAGERALAYQEGGAAMVSVLTDATWFDGSLDDLRAARERLQIPLLCKDFLIDPVQVDHAWAAGADAALVIVRCVSRDRDLKGLVDGALACGVEPFVEVVDERELGRALEAGARLVGVNARDLDTLQMDAARATRVLEQIPSGVVAVHLSGLKTPDDAARIGNSRADAALIGEALMRTDQPTEALRMLVAGAARKN